MRTSSLTQNYGSIVDWNALFVGKEYQSIPEPMLKPMLDIIPTEWNLKEGYWFEAYLDFCPKCGFMGLNSTDNMASYPEAYYRTTCANCSFLISMVDNSPCAIWYQYKDNDYVVEI